MSHHLLEFSLRQPVEQDRTKQHAPTPTHVCVVASPASDPSPCCSVARLPGAGVQAEGLLGSQVACAWLPFCRVQGGQEGLPRCRVQIGGY